MTGAQARESAARSWVEHLRSGGATPWLAWAGTAHDGPEQATGRVPGAAHLEVLRRLASVAGGDPGFARLADRVLGTPGPGRGMIDVPLSWPGTGPSSGASPATGALPMDPAEIPVDELTRICVGVLADLVVNPGLQLPAQPRGEAPRRRPWAKQFMVAGSPGTAQAVRAALTARGHVQGGRKPQVVVLGRSVDAMMQEQWAFRVRSGAGVRWSRLWSLAEGRRSLPPRLDLAAVAARWAERVGPQRVTVALVPDPPAGLQAVADRLGLDAGGLPEQVAVASSDLGRRLNLVLGGAVDRARHRELLETVLPSMLAAPPDAPIGVPDRQRGWAADQVASLAERLAAADYAVVGDRRELEARADLPAAPDPGATLELALRACVRAAQTRRER